MVSAGTPVSTRPRTPQAGDDPGFAERFRATGLRVEWVGTVSYNDYLASFDDVSLELAPLCLETPFSTGKSCRRDSGLPRRTVAVIGSEAGEHGWFFTG